jgi:hypothetical protein
MNNSIIKQTTNTTVHVFDTGKEPPHTFISGHKWMFHPGPAQKLSTDLYDIYHCECTVNELLMMDRGTVRNM